MNRNFNILLNKVKPSISNYRYDEEENEYTILILTDKSKIYEFTDGISISYNDLTSGKFIMVGEEIK